MKPTPGAAGSMSRGARPARCGSSLFAVRVERGPGSRRAGQFAPHVGELREGLRRGLDAGHLDSLDSQAEDRPEGRHPMVRVGFQARSAEGARLDDEVVALDPRVTPGAGELGGDGGQPVGLVGAQLTDVPQPRGAVGEGGDGGDGGHELADVVHVRVQRRDAVRPLQPERRGIGS